MPRTRLLALTALVALVTVGAASACRPGEQRAEPADSTASPRAELSEGARAQLDSGNVAYRGSAYEEALRHYTRVTELAPDDATGWFGVYMAQHVMGNLEEADAALQRSKELAPGASLIHPDTSLIHPDTSVIRPDTGSAAGAVP